jgi:hypothetical protein
MYASLRAVVDAVVVRFDKKTGNFEEKRVANLDVAFSAFKAALYLWKTSKVQVFDTRVGTPSPAIIATAVTTTTGSSAPAPVTVPADAAVEAPLTS